MNNQKPSVLRWALPLGILIIACVIAFFIVQLKTSPQKSKAKKPAFTIEALDVNLSDYAPQITLYAVVEAPRLVKAAAPSFARVLSVPVKEGQLIKQGELVFSLDEADFLPAVLEAESAIETQQLQYEMDIQSGKNKLQIDKAYQAKMKALQARLMQAKTNLERSQLRAPADAVIADVMVSAGDYANKNAPLVSYYTIDALEIRASLPKRYVQGVEKALREGEQIVARALEGEFVLARLAGNAKGFGVEALLEPVSVQSRLRPGMTLTVDLTLDKQAGLFAVPPTALYAGDRVFLVEDGKLSALKVERAGMMNTSQGKKVLIRSEAFAKGGQVMVTHLPNAVDGLNVKVKGQAGNDRSPRSAISVQ